MMPKTVHGLSAMACVSAMQKCIRRSMEREAMEFAVELVHSSKAFFTMTCNRLEVICHEDLDTLEAPYVVPFVRASLEQARARYDVDKPGEARLMVGNAIRAMCRSPKSRAGCHFAAAIGLRAALEDFAPTIPDWAHDQHTYEGKRMGRGIEYFRRESAKLVHEPPGPDPYIEEAYRLWKLKEQRVASKRGQKPLIDDEE